MRRQIRMMGRRSGALVVLILLAAAAGVGGSLPLMAATDQSLKPTPIEINLPEVTETTLPNGLRLIVMERHSAPLVNLSLVVPVGHVHSPREQPLLAEMTAVLLEGGTERLSARELAKQLEELGANVSASTAADDSTLSVTAVSHEYQQALALLAEMVTGPAFPEAELALRKEMTHAALDGMRDDPALLAKAHAEAMVYGSGHPLGAYPTHAEVDALKVGDLRSFYRQHWRPQGARLLVVGDVRTDDVVAAVTEQFGRWKENADAPADPTPPAGVRALKGPRVRFVEKPGLSQVSIHLMQPGIPWNDPRHIPSGMFTAALGNAGFSSRLMGTVRDRDGLTYGVSATQSSTAQSGTYSIATFTGTETLGAMMQTLRKEVTTFVRDGVTPDELDVVKSLWVGSYPMRFDSLAGMVGEVRRALSRGETLSALERRAFTYDSVQLEQVNRTLKELLSPDSWVIVLVGDPAALQEAPNEIWGVPLEKVERVSWTDPIDG